MSQKEYIGFGTIDLCRSILEDYSARNILLITGNTSYNQSGAEVRFRKLLAGYKVYTFNDFQNNPKIEDIIRGLELFISVELDTVIAVGGGSVIDMAKLINISIENKLDLFEYINGHNRIIKKGKPLIAIPTTAGSGSEATHFAVFYANRKKYSVAHEYILPEVAIVDPELTMSLPPKPTAESGMDALCQAIESYWSINSTEESKRFAKRSIELIMPNIAKAVNNPDKSSRSAMAEAAHLAGKAINITKTSAAHAISYPLTAFFNISHGHAVALTLSSLLDYNYYVTKEDLLDTRGCDYVRKTINEITNFLRAESKNDAKKRIDALMKEVGLETKLRQLGIKFPDDIEKIIENVFASDRAKNNPRALTPQAVRKILHRIY